VPGRLQRGAPPTAVPVKAPGTGCALLVTESFSLLQLVASENSIRTG
jgi:hypothetical protein